MLDCVSTAQNYTTPVINRAYKLNVAWNNCFRRIFNGFWRENVKPLLFYCNTMPLMSVDQRRLTLPMKITCSWLNQEHVIFIGRVSRLWSTDSWLCDYDFGALAAIYNINCVHISNRCIRPKSAVWSSFAECLYFVCDCMCVCVWVFVSISLYSAVILCMYV